MPTERPTLAPVLKTFVANLKRQNEKRDSLGGQMGGGQMGGRAPEVKDKIIPQVVEKSGSQPIEIKKISEELRKPPPKRIEKSVNVAKQQADNTYLYLGIAAVLLASQL